MAVKLNRFNQSTPGRSSRALVLTLASIVALALFAPCRTRASQDLDQDIRKLNRFVQGSQNTPSMRVFREGRDLIEQERWPQAAEKFRGFIQQYPGDRNVDAALYWLAYALKKQGMFREAAQYLTRLMREFPRSTWANEAEAMLTEMAPQLGNRRVIEEGLSKDDDELKIVALQSLFESNPERAIGYVAEMMKPGSKANPSLKEAAVQLLGSHGGKQAVPLLLEIARTQSDPQLRGAAIHHLGDEGGEAVIDDLTRLYDTERDPQLRAQILRAFGEIPGPRAHAKLMEVARKQDEDPELRKWAIHFLAENREEEAVDDLIKLYASERDTELRAHILHSLAELDAPRAVDQLLQVARHGEDPELRERAIHFLGEKKSDAVVNELMKIYDVERDTEVRGSILHSFSEMETPRARAKLLEAARGSAGEDEELRKRAIHFLGEHDDAQTVQSLIQIYDAERSVEVKQGILHALSESKQKTALRKLMDVARRDSSVELRKMAVHLLGESRDPEVLRFLEELLNK